MADNEKNVPMQEPIDQENEIKDLQPDLVDETEEVAEQPSEESAAAVEESDNGDVPTDSESEPEAVAEVSEEAAETEAEPQPVEEAAEEPTEEISGEVVEDPVAETVEESAEEATEEPAEESLEEPAEEDVEESTEEAVEEPTEEASEEPTEEQPEVTENYEEEPKEEEPAAEPVEESAEEVSEETTEEVLEESTEESVEEPVEEAVEEPAEETAEEPTEEASEEPTEEQKLEFTVGEDGELELVNDASEEKSDEEAEAEQQDTEDEDFVDPDDLVIHDEIVKAIKAEGAKLENNELSLRAYIKHSKEAIKNFETSLAIGQKAYDANKDEKEIPVILAGIIKISTQLLEIKCNNLENIVRVKAYKYIKDMRTALHVEIDRYNDLVIEYASVTGEQLTRMSTFLPENISSGKSLAVVPELTYYESYVQVNSDEELNRDDVVTTMVVNTPVTADLLLHDIAAPLTRSACSSYIRKIKRATARLNEESKRISKLLAENKVARKRYESELASLEKRTPLADRATREYKNKVFAINVKYGRRIAGIDTLKTRSAFARTKLRLLVNRFMVEREKLVLAYECVRAVYGVGNLSKRKAAEELFAAAVENYNQSAERCSKATGIAIERLPVAIVEYASRGERITFPVIAYKRELVERLGCNARAISMHVNSNVAPNEEAYAESSDKILGNKERIINTSTLNEESAMADRASAIARVVIENLKESADLVLTIDEFEQFNVKSKKAIRYFNKALKNTEKAMSRAFDENGVVTALVENLRVISNLIEVRRLCVSVCVKLKRNDLARNHGRALYKNIELYNGRAIDYMSIVGEQFSRITTATSKELIDSADKIRVPVITYKDNYIEVFPKDPLKESVYEKPKLWRSGVYTPLLMQHYRLTENRAVETTVINSPFVFDVMTDDMPAVSWWHPIGFVDHLMIWSQPIQAWWNRICTNIDIWFVDETLLLSRSGLTSRQIRNDRKKAKFERKLKKLNAEHAARIVALETVVHETDRHSASYQKQLYEINTKFSRKIYRLKMRWMRECTGLNATRLLLERLVLERERLTGINQVLIKYRSYGRITFTRNILTTYKKRFISAINAHNTTARKLSEVLGVQFAEVSTSVADEIIRYGKMIKFPEIVCCREVIETIDGKQRTVGDKWHGYGLYTGTSGASAAAKGDSPIMSVGAMGYATNMGVPYLKADFDGMTMIGMTAAGVPLIGFSANGETAMPFTGTPMMLAGVDGGMVLDAGLHGQDSLILGAANVTDPYSGINKRGVDENYNDETEDDAKDLRSGCEVETPLDLESKLIEERFTRALRARSMTSVDNVANWWKLVGSEINVRFMRFLVLNPHGFLRFLLPPRDPFVETVNSKVSKEDSLLLQNIAKVGGVVEIECKRLYSATKTGIRRSQRVWSAWLHEDIELYNKLVKEYNSRHERYMHIEPLSLNIPDTIIFRKTDRPPTPPVLSLRNRVKIDETRATITTDGIYDKLVEYAKSGLLRYASPFAQFWAEKFTIPSLEKQQKKGKPGALLPKITGMIQKRSNRSYSRRQSNELRHLLIRYEKARAMKRYNRRTIRAIGVANDPIKYQTRVHKVLRDYLSTNFRIDYNMRIYQLITRALRVDLSIYWIVTLALATVIAVAAALFARSPGLQVLVMIGIVWAALPIVLLLLNIVYNLVMFVAQFFLIGRGIVLLKYGARDIERNRYGAILECFVSDQYKLLLECEKLRLKPKSNNQRKKLIATVNDYNKRAEVYSEILRVPIRQVELTDLIDKLCSGESHQLTELQNFVYVRELVERVDKHQRGKTLKDKELTELVGEVNQIISSVNLAGSDNQIAVDFLQGAMQRLIAHLQMGIRPTQNQRYELKRDLIQGISQFDIGVAKKELFARDVIKIVDHIGGKDSRRIISIIAEDDMIL